MGSIASYYTILKTINTEKSEDELYEEIKLEREKDIYKRPDVIINGYIHYFLIEIFSPRIENDIDFSYQWTLATIATTGEIENIVMKKELVYSYITKKTLADVIEYLTQINVINMVGFSKYYWNYCNKIIGQSKHLRKTYEQDELLIFKEFHRLIIFYQECLKTKEDFYIMIQIG